MAELGCAVLMLTTKQGIVHRISSLRTYPARRLKGNAHLADLFVTRIICQLVFADIPRMRIGSRGGTKKAS